jgi:hypothetical protein
MALYFNLYWRQAHDDSNLWRLPILAVIEASVG